MNLDSKVKVDIVLLADQLEGTTAMVSQWLVEVGAMVNAGEPLLELETDKVSMELCASVSGRLESVFKQVGDNIEPNTVIGQLMTEGSAQACTSNRQMTQSPSSPKISPQPKVSRDNSRLLVGPAVRRLLRTHNLDIDLIKGTGRDGRVTRDDVQEFLVKQSSPNTFNNQLPRGEILGTKLPHSPMRKSIAKHMVHSLLHAAPHVTSVFELDLSNVIEHRRRHKREFFETGVNLTYTAYFLAAAVKAISEVPQINARFHEEFLEVFKQINIGVGTALGENGLVVPVVRDVQNKTLLEIASELQRQIEKARSDKLRSEDIQNGTFTISNHGVSGSLFATPIIINQPQVAILGVGKMEKRAVVRAVGGLDEISIKTMCYVSLTIDHRALDAYQTNQFLKVLVETLEGWGV